MFSSSQAMFELGSQMIESMQRGFEQAEAREAELIASGMTLEEAGTVMLRELFADPGFHEAMAYAEGVARRSFPTLYEYDEDDPSAT